MNTSFLQRCRWWLPVFLLSLVLDQRVFLGLQLVQHPAAATFLAYICSFLFFIALAVVAVETIIWHDRRELILPVVLAFGVALWIGMVVKGIVALPRPYVAFNILPLVTEPGFSFPSLHTIAAFSLYPLIWYKNKKIARGWLLFSVLIAFSRLYLQVHYLSDVVTGAFIGYETSHFFMQLEQRHGIFSRFNKLLQEKLEIRRQLLHTVFGLAFVFFYKTYLITTDTLFILLLISGVLILLLKIYHWPRWLHDLLAQFEREQHIVRFPARGMFFFMLGSWLTLLLFDDRVALAAILILAFGDSVTNIVGRYFGKRTIFYNRKKHWEGTWAGIFFATIAASWLVPLWPALLASTVAMLLESYDWKIGSMELDDNVLIPLVAAIVLSFIS